jgi:hypothetical protein
VASTVVEGAPVVQRHADGRVEIVQAPPRARFTLGFLAGADPHLVRADGNTITLAGQVEYRVVGWDFVGSALLAELSYDRRSR